MTDATTPIDVLDLSVRAHNELTNMRITTIDELLRMDPAAFLRRRFGSRRCLAEIRVALGLWFLLDWPIGEDVGTCEYPRGFWRGERRHHTQR